jgi:hypothetical protein
VTCHLPPAAAHRPPPATHQPPANHPPPDDDHLPSVTCGGSVFRPGIISKPERGWRLPAFGASEAKADYVRMRGSLRPGHVRPCWMAPGGAHLRYLHFRGITVRSEGVALGNKLYLGEVNARSLLASCLF